MVENNMKAIEFFVNLLNIIQQNEIEVQENNR